MPILAGNCCNEEGPLEAWVKAWAAIFFHAIRFFLLLQAGTLVTTLVDGVIQAKGIIRIRRA